MSQLAAFDAHFDSITTTSPAPSVSFGADVVAKEFATQPTETVISGGGSSGIDLADDVPCSTKTTGGLDGVKSLRIGSSVMGRGRGRGGRGTTFVPSRFDHPSMQEKTDRVSTTSKDEGDGIIRDGFCSGEFIIGGVKYTHFCAVSPNYSRQMFRIRLPRMRDIIVNSQPKFTIVFFNEQGDFMVRGVDVVHGSSDGQHQHRAPRSSSIPRYQSEQATQRPQRDYSRGRVSQGPSQTTRRTNSVIRTVAAFD